MKNFEYSSNDLKKKINSISDLGNTDSNESKDFDQILEAEWMHKKDEGLFKYKLDQEIDTKYLPGKFNFVLQFNPKRFTEKRAAEFKINSLNEAFNAKNFNFTKINDREILIRLSKENDTSEIDSNENLVIINNSPVNLFSSLIVPRRYSLHNQTLNEYCLNLAVEISLMSNSRNKIIGFNSLKTYASVNHQHLHFVYLNTDSIREVQCPDRMYPFPVQNINVGSRVTDKLWFIGEEFYFVPSFALQLCEFQNDISDYVKKIYSLISYFMENSIAHTLAMFKARPLRTLKDENSNEEDTMQTIRTVIYLRKHRENIVQNEKEIIFALSEFSGQFLMPSIEHYNTMTEEYLLDSIKLGRLETSEINDIHKDLKSIFEKN